MDKAEKKPSSAELDVELEGVYAKTGEEPEAGSGSEERTEEPGGEGKEKPKSSKGNGQEQGGEGEPEGEGEEASGPPETYAWNLPEGMELDQAGIEQFEPIAREWGLTQKQLDQAVGLYADRMQQTVESVVDAMMTRAEEQSEAWAKETQADKKVGKTGLQAAARAIERFGSAELKEAFNDTGMGNHPEVVRFCQRVGEALAEDRLEIGQGVGSQIPSDDEIEDKGIYA